MNANNFTTIDLIPKDSETVSLEHFVKNWESLKNESSEFIIIPPSLDEGLDGSNFGKVIVKYKEPKYCSEF